MRIYLAARYSRNADMRAVRDFLVEHGHTVTSRWIDQHGGDVLESFVGEQLNSDPEGCARYGIADVQDLRAADAVVSFTYPEGGGKGGRHVEFGMGLGLGKQMLLVGPREHIFHTLPGVKHFEDWPSFAARVQGGGLS